MKWYALVPLVLVSGVIALLGSIFVGVAALVTAPFGGAKWLDEFFADI